MNSVCTYHFGLRLWLRKAYLIFCLVVSFLMGCTPKSSILPVIPGNIPKGFSVSDLLKQGDLATERGERDDLLEAFSAYKNVLALDAHQTEALWKGARTAFLLSLKAKTSEERLSYALMGEGLAEQGIQSNPKIAESHYYLALNTGLHAQEKSLEASELVHRMIQSCEKVIELNPTLDHAGPHRLLGRIYTQVPPPPVSFGDPDLAIEHLMKAVELAPDYLPNRLHLAEALIQADEEDQAREYLFNIQETTTQKDLIYEGQSIHNRALDILKQLDK